MGQRDSVVQGFETFIIPPTHRFTVAVTDGGYIEVTQSDGMGNESTLTLDASEARRLASAMLRAARWLRANG